jgi:hypothetical protein
MIYDYAYLTRMAFASAIVSLGALSACSGEDPDSSNGDESQGDGDSSGGTTAGSGGSATGGASTGGGMNVGDGSIFGGPCEVDEDCQQPTFGGLVSFCDIGWESGQCTANCLISEGCGDGAVCDAGTGECHRACSLDEDCREGYSCFNDRSCTDFSP